MTTNAFIFSWDCDGIESIVPISQYENWDAQQLINLLKEQKRKPNPLNSILRNLILRAQFNPQRHYEIYTIDCDKELDEKFWREQWEELPQFTADLIREKGHKIYSNRQTKQPVIV